MHESDTANQRILYLTEFQKNLMDDLLKGQDIMKQVYTLTPLNDHQAFIKALELNHDHAESPHVSIYRCDDLSVVSELVYKIGNDTNHPTGPFIQFILHEGQLYELVVKGDLFGHYELVVGLAKRYINIRPVDRMMLPTLTANNGDCVEVKADQIIDKARIKLSTWIIFLNKVHGYNLKNISHLRSRSELTKIYIYQSDLPEGT